MAAMSLAAKLKAVLPTYVEIDYANNTTILVSLFKNVTNPEVRT